MRTTSTQTERSCIEEDLVVALINFTTQVNYLEHVNDDIGFALKHSEQALKQRSEEMFRRLESDEKLGRSISDLGEHVGFETLGKWGAEFSLKLSQQRFDSAVIVFLHSLLDAAIFGYVQMTFRLAPERWLGFVGERKVTVNDVITNSAQALEQVARHYLAALERESLQMKIDRLCAVCRPKPKQSFVKDFAFSMDELERLDQLRHQIVHGTHFKSASQHRARLATFTLKTGVHFGKMVAHSFCLNLKVPSSRLVNRLQGISVS